LPETVNSVGKAAFSIPENDEKIAWNIEK